MTTIAAPIEVPTDEIEEIEEMTINIEEPGTSINPDIETLLQDTTARLDDLQQQGVQLVEQLANLATERDSLERRVSQLDKEHDAFKKQVVDVASRYAEMHGWCGTIDEALEELGLERRPSRYTATLAITVSFLATMSSRRDLPDESWVDSSVRQTRLERAIRDGFSLDGDHSDSSVINVEFEVTDVSEFRND